MKKSFKITGLDCANCGAKIEREIAKLPGVTEARVSFMMQKLSITADDAAFDSAVEQAKKIAARVEPGCAFS